MNSFKVQHCSNKAICKAAVAVSLSKLNSLSLTAGLGIRTKFMSLQFLYVLVILRAVYIVVRAQQPLFHCKYTYSLLEDNVQKDIMSSEVTMYFLELILMANLQHKQMCNLVAETCSVLQHSHGQHPLFSICHIQVISLQLL